MSARSGLRRAYEEALYTAELPGGTVTWRLGRPPEGPAPERALAIVTAWNPGGARRPPAVNREANCRLAAALAAGGFEPLPAHAAAADGTHAEPSFAITPVSAEQALAYARQFGQAAAFFWDGRAAALLWTD